MSSTEVHRFLRFVTGSSVAIGKTITIIFNGTEGAGMIPVAHTCSCQLELSVNYTTSIGFATDFNAVLANELSWTMDAW